MTIKVLVVFATDYGSTKEVAEAIAAIFRENDVEVDFISFREVRTVTGYSGIVMGSPLLMFRLHKDIKNFLSRNRNVLINLPVALFVLGPVKNPHDEKEWQGSKEQLEKELLKYSWLKPISIMLFGGKFDPKLLRFPLNKMAGNAPASDIRDWKAIRSWAESVIEKLK